MKFNTEAELKDWLAEKLNNSLLVKKTYDKNIIRGQIKIFGINSNSEPGSTKKFGIISPTKKTVWPDLVGKITIDNITRKLYVEAVIDRGFKEITHSVRQALQYKGRIEDVFLLHPKNVVLLATDTWIGKKLHGLSAFAGTARNIWGLGMGVIYKEPYSSHLSIALNEQERFDIFEHRLGEIKNYEVDEK